MSVACSVQRGLDGHAIAELVVDEPGAQRIDWLRTVDERRPNDHHRFPGAVRQRFRRWQIDLSYSGLRVLTALRLVWDLNSVHQRVAAGGYAPEGKV